MIEKYMKEAITEAKNSENDIPVGAVLIKNDKIIAKAHNLKEKLNDVTAHAEILAIREASKILSSWRLDECELYVTLEPCPMCAAAIIQSRIKSVCFGANDFQYGALGGKTDLRQVMNSNLKVNGAIMENECKTLINNYFEGLRK